MSNVMFYCLFWYVISAWSNVTTKFLLSEFPYPMTVTLVQLVVVTLLANFRKDRKSKLEVANIEWSYYLKFVVPLAFGKFMGNVLTYVSIWKVPVSYANTVKASMPLFTVLLSRFILQERQTVNIYLSLIPIVAGVAIATMSEINFNAIGLLSSIISTLVISFQNIFSKKVLNDTGIHHLTLLSMISKLSLFMFLPIWLIYDAQPVSSSLISLKITNRTLGLLLLDSFLNWLHNVAVYSVMSCMSSLSFAVANACKIVFIILVSLIVLGNPVSVTNVLGMAMTVTGVVCKVTFEHRQSDKKTL